MHSKEINKARLSLAVHIMNRDLNSLEQELNSLGDNVTIVLNSFSHGTELPLITALGSLNLDALKLLVKHGADINAMDGFGQRALDVIVAKLDNVKELNEFTILMQSGVYLLLKNINNGSGTINQFLIYMLRMQNFLHRIPNVYGEFYSIIDKALKKLSPLFKELTDMGIDKFTTCAEEVIRAGQILGLETKINIHLLDTSIIVTSEDNQTPFSKLYLDEILNGYIDSIANLDEKHRFEQIRLALEGKHPHIRMLPISWGDHEIYIASFGDNIILSNRGDYENPEFSGVKIFKAKELPIDLIALRARAVDATSFEAAMAQLIDANIPAHTFPLKTQQHGTCTFVNAKSMIAPLLHLLGDSYAHASYKKITSWMRDREVDHLLMKFIQSKLQKDKPACELYFQLLCKYCLKIFTRENKTKTTRASDTQRFAKILDVFATFKKGRAFMQTLESKKNLIELASLPIRIDIKSEVLEYNPVDIIDLNALQCQDLELQNAIIANFKQREFDLKVSLELLRISPNNAEQAKLIAELNSLEDDWERFTQAIGDNIYKVASGYAEKRKNLWVVSSIFGTHNEYQSLLELENVAKIRLG